jgi:hypothetical protein
LLDVLPIVLRTVIIRSISTEGVVRNTILLSTEARGMKTRVQLLVRVTAGVGYGEAMLLNSGYTTCGVWKGWKHLNEKSLDM